MTVKVVRLEQKDPRLGRNVVHDSRSRAFAAYGEVDTSAWVSRRIRLYDPLPNPDQSIGNCTGCAKAMEFNTVGNRTLGRVLHMADADSLYSLATSLDPWDGSWPPDDTGSSGLAVAKAAQQLLGAGAYHFIFSGAGGVGEAVQDGKAVLVGTRWDFGMFTPDVDGRVHPGGSVAGGHEWVVRGYDKKRNWYLARCWWGHFRDFWIAAGDLDELLADDGDAHVQDRA